MPLKKSKNRTVVHNRKVHCIGYIRHDNLWDIEGHLIDTKTYNFTTAALGEVKAGSPVHNMSIRVTLDNSLKIHNIEIDMSANPYPTCPAIIPNFKRLIGVHIRKGFRKKVYEIVGGINGCTHLVELLFPIATTAFQTIYSYKNKEKKGGTPKLINSCHSWRENGELIKKEFPEFYKE